MFSRRVKTAPSNESSTNLETVKSILSEATKQQDMLQEAYTKRFETMQDNMKLREERIKLRLALAFAIYIIICMVYILNKCRM